MRLPPLFPLRHPCPCGSGKRFKNCCDGSVSIDPVKVRDAEIKRPGAVRAMIDALEMELAQRGEK